MTKTVTSLASRHLLSAAVILPGLLLTAMLFSTSIALGDMTMPTNAYVDPKTVPLDTVQSKPPSTFGEPVDLCKLNDGNLSQNDCYLTIHNSYARYRDTYWPIYQASQDEGYAYPAFQIVVIEEIYKTNAARPYRPATTPNTDPHGYLDGVSCESIVGWAQDLDLPTAPITVYIAIDKPFSGSDTSGFVGAVTAGQYRSDLCSVVGTCNHAFSFPTPAKFKDGLAHKVYAYAVNTPPGNNPLLWNSSREFTCGTPKPAESFTKIRDDVFVLKSFTGIDGQSLLRPSPGGTDIIFSEVFKKFYAHYPDQYDFILLYTDYHFPLAEEVRAAYTQVHKIDDGISPATNDHFSQGQEYIGCTKCPLGFALFDTKTAFIDSQGNPDIHVVAHEISHRWLARVENEGLANDESDHHWTIFVDTGTQTQDGKIHASPNGGRAYVDNGDGTFTLVNSEQDRFSSMDLYLMGLLPASEAKPLSIWSPTNNAQVPTPNTKISGTKKTVTVDDIIATYGERNPSYANAQKKFSVGYILAVANPTATDVDTIKALASGLPAVWKEYTSGASEIVAPGAAVATTTPSVQPTATITSSNQTSSTRPTIAGTAKGTALVSFSISSGYKVYGSGAVTVTDGKWSHTVASAVSPGTYTVLVYDSNSSLLATSTLKISGTLPRSFGLTDVKAVTKKYVDPSSSVGADEYTLYTVTLRSNRVVEAKIGDTATPEMRTQGFRNAGYTGDISKLIAKAVVAYNPTEAGGVLGASVVSLSVALDELTEVLIELRDNL